MAALRRFFEAEGFIEVETAILQVSPGNEAHLHAFTTDRLSPDRQQHQRLYLHTSPEFAMKRLLYVCLAVLIALLIGFVWGRSGRASLSRTLEAAELRNDLHDAHAAVLVARLDIYSVNFGEASRNLESARASLERILDWEFDRVIMSHGEVLEHDGRAAVEKAFARYLRA